MSSVDAQINELCRQVEILSGKIGAKQGEYKAKEKELERCRKRKREVEKIYKNLRSSFDGLVDCVVDRQEKTRAKFEGATSGFSHEEAVSAELARDREKAPESDSYGSQVSHYLQAEIVECDRKINEAQSDMASIWGQIDSWKSKRASYARRALDLASHPDATVRVAICTDVLRGL